MCAVGAHPAWMGRARVRKPINLQTFYNTPAKPVERKKSKKTTFLPDTPRVLGPSMPDTPHPRVLEALLYSLCKTKPDPINQRRPYPPSRARTINAALTPTCSGHCYIRCAKQSPIQSTNDGLTPPRVLGADVRRRRTSGTDGPSTRPQNDQLADILQHHRKARRTKKEQEDNCSAGRTPHPTPRARSSKPTDTPTLACSGHCYIRCAKQSPIQSTNDGLIPLACSGQMYAAGVHPARMGRARVCKTIKSATILQHHRKDCRTKKEQISKKGLTNRQKCDIIVRHSTSERT